MKNYVLETCTDCVLSAIEAQKGGATRIELCSNLVIGGVSPSLSLFKLVKKYTDLKVRVLLRPRYGDYCYNNYEFEELNDEVAMFRDAGADGVVIGSLNPDDTLNLEHLFRLKETAGSMETALHRAFDVCIDPMAALEQAVTLGFDTILTGGQALSAWDGRDMLRKLHEKSRGRIEILAAGGICRSVIENLLPYTGITSYHMSGKIEIESLMKYRKDGASMGLPERNEYKLLRTDSRQIAGAVSFLEQAFCTPKE